MPPLDFRPPPSVTDRLYVSYAWKDNAPGGHEREIIVDAICAAAGERGTPVQRDKDRLGLGDDIKAFMTELGAGHRVFVVMSDKYLKSPNCMYELHELWRTSKQEAATFMQRVRMFALPDAKIWTLKDRLAAGIYWKQELDSIEPLVRGNLGGVGQSAFEEFILMQSFHTQVVEILSTLARYVQPRTLDQLKQYGFSDLPPPT